MPALASAASDEVPQLFPLVAELLPVPEARDLIQYFENTYIGRVLPAGGVQAPLIPISMWNYYLETPFGLPRTNNAVESWHRSFNATVGCQHPSICRFINALKRELALVEFKQAKFITGTRPTKRQRDQSTNNALKETCPKFLLHAKDGILPWSGTSF